MRRAFAAAWEFAQEKLAEAWSPEPIAGHQHAEYLPSRSHETIYQRPAIVEGRKRYCDSLAIEFKSDRTRGSANPAWPHSTSASARRASDRRVLGDAD